MGHDVTKPWDLDVAFFAWIKAEYVWRSWLSKTCRHISDTLDIGSSELANSMVLKLQFFVCVRICNTALAEDKRSRPEWERGQPIMLCRILLLLYMTNPQTWTAIEERQVPGLCQDHEMQQGCPLSLIPFLIEPSPVPFTASRDHESHPGSHSSPHRKTLQRPCHSELI